MLRPSLFHQCSPPPKKKAMKLLIEGQTNSPTWRTTPLIQSDDCKWMIKDPAALGFLSVAGNSNKLPSRFSSRLVRSTFVVVVFKFKRLDTSDLSLPVIPLFLAQELRICTLALAVDVCLNDSKACEAKDLFLEAQQLACKKLREAQEAQDDDTVKCGVKDAVKSMNLDQAEIWDEVGDGDDARYEDYPNKADLDENPEVPRSSDESALRTDGMPSWLSPREGHLVALLACHVAWLKLVLMPPLMDVIDAVRVL